MVGAGFSKNAVCPAQHSRGFPDWAGLGDSLYKRLRGKEPAPSERYMSIPQLAQEVEATIGRPALDQLLRVAIPDRECSPSLLHKKLVELPWIDIFTTNYDTLLERASSSIVTQKYDIVVTQEDLVYSKSPRIIKLHGSFSSNRPFIITDEDYRRYPTDFAPFVNTVQQRLIESTLCLIGFSGNDPNFVKWIGWIQDTLGTHGSAKMYLIAMTLSPSERRMLEQRNIVVVDLSTYSGIGDKDHYEAMRRFIDYLGQKKTDHDNLNWPRASDHDTATPSCPDPSDSTVVQEISALTGRWRRQRRTYPGWVILPKDRRDYLWADTQEGVRLFPPKEPLPPYLDLEFSFELVWRLEKGLHPLYTGDLPFLETTVDRYLEQPQDSSGTEGGDPPRMATASGAKDLNIREMADHLLLALLRTYREEGRLEDWARVAQRIEVALPRMASRYRARFYYERALSALYELNLKNLQQYLEAWPVDTTLPFWEAKRAGILAYIGQATEAERILEESLAAIRTRSNLRPVTTDYSLSSQESYVMVLLSYVKQTIRDQSLPRSENRDLLQHLTERWQVLRQHKCDPWKELNTFQQALAIPPPKHSSKSERPGFDIGHVKRSYSMGPPQGVLVAYRYLRFREDAGLPLLLHTKTTIRAASRIVSSDPYWATASFIQTGMPSETHQVFDREMLARFDTSYVDSLIDRYLDALEVAAQAQVSGGRLWSSKFDALLTKVIPEVLSRLCSKASDEAKHRLIDCLVEIHKSRTTSTFSGVANLTKRLLATFSSRQRAGLIPRLLEIPNPGKLQPVEDKEFLNPFAFLSIHEEWVVEFPTIRRDRLSALIAESSSQEPSTRRWAVTTLVTLHHLGMLEVGEEEQFAIALWRHLDDDGLPAETGYRRFSFLTLPHPPWADPASAFKRYVRRAQFYKPNSSGFTHRGESSLCRDIQGAAGRMTWSDAEVQDVIGRLHDWWEADKHKLQDDENVGFLSISAEYRARFLDLIKALVAIVDPPFVAAKGSVTRQRLEHLVQDVARRGLPVLHLRNGLLHIFPEWRSTTALFTKEAMAASSKDTVEDALRTLRALSHSTCSEDSPRKDELIDLLTVAAEILYWRRETALGSAIYAVADVISKHPWVLTGDIEMVLLSGLRFVKEETAIAPGGDGKDAVAQQGLDVSTKLMIREPSAHLAFTINNVYKARDTDIPDVIREWEAICQSEEEYAEIRNQWIA